MKEFTILAPMRGKYEGHISLHGIERETIKEVEEYAKNRFLPDTKYVIVLDDDYPELYQDFYTNEWYEQVKRIYNENLKK